MADFTRRMVMMQVNKDIGILEPRIMLSPPDEYGLVQITPPWQEKDRVPASLVYEFDDELMIRVNKLAVSGVDLTSAALQTIAMSGKPIEDADVTALRTADTDGMVTH
jgi:hypothetical protein